MKLKLLVAACGLALGGQAFALSPAVTDNAGTIKLYLSGSSAQARVIKAIAAADCNGPSLDTYQLVGDTGNTFAVSCTLAGASNLAGKNIVITYNANGGSAQGVYPIAQETVPGGAPTLGSTTVQRPQLTNFSSCTLASPNLYNCTNTAAQWSDAGVSDTEPSLFNIALNRPAGFTAISDAQFAQMNGGQQFQQIFGIAVSQHLYDDLQAMQVASGQIQANGIPSLSKSAIAGYLSGSFAANGLNAWQPLFATSTLAIPANANGTVTICTRTTGSGTKAGSNAFFLQNPCGQTADQQVPVTAAAAPSGWVVNEGSGTGNAITCLQSANAAAAPNQYAIGIIGHENAVSPGAQFIAIDGVAPSTANVKNGLYDWYVEQSMQWNPTYISNFKNLAGTGVTASDVLTFLDSFRTRSGSPDIMATYSTTVQDGVAAIADGVNYIFNDPANANNKKFVSRVTKLGNTCGVSQWGS